MLTNPGSSLRLPAKERITWVLAVWGACLVYAIIRYNVFKGVEWTHLPLYIVNKSAAFGGVIFIALAYVVGKLFGGTPGSELVRAKAKFFGLTGFGMISMHILMSMVLLSPANYEKFFAASGKLNLTGEVMRRTSLRLFVVPGDHHPAPHVRRVRHGKLAAGAALGLRHAGPCLRSHIRDGIQGVD